MNFFKLIIQSKLCISREDEIELNYLFGKKFNYIYSKRSKEFEFEKKKQPRFTGIFFQSLIFFYKLFQNFKFSKKNFREKPIYIFSSSLNQLNSMKSTIEALKIKGDNFHLTVFKNLLEKNRQEVMTAVQYTLKVLLVSIYLFTTKAFHLFIRLKREGKNKEISWYFHKFCETYIYVPFFLEELQKIRPKLVLISNDHTVQARSLRISAEILGIKTLYMQHASVSEIFPPLEFDYALLDGEIAYQIYTNCYKIQDKKSEKIKQNVSECQILLTGQKKLVFKKIKKKYSRLRIGIATTKQDNFNFVRKLLDSLKSIQIQCIVRTHPSQSLIFIEKLKHHMKGNDLLTWSNSQEQPIHEYFMNIDALIASNSSIHLEAALVNLPTFYHEMSDEVFISDYYGYVKNSISKKLEENFSAELINFYIDELLLSEKRKLAIKKYSETFGSLWQNREGELTALIIDNILNNQSLEEFFEIKEAEIYKTIGNIK